MADPQRSSARPAGGSEPASCGAAGCVLTALLLSPLADDYKALKEIFLRARWQLYFAYHFSQAFRLLRQHRMPVLICERDLCPGDWKSVLECLRQAAEPPLLIVISPLSSEELWAEAFTLGAFDVLAKPLEEREVTRVVSLAWAQWKERHAAGSPAQTSTAGGL